MSLSIGHFAAGASASFVIIHFLPPGIRATANRHGIPGILGGLWAMAPDAANLLPSLRPVHDSPWANIFFFHHLMDILDRNDSVLVSSFLIGLMITFMLILLANDFWASRVSRKIGLRDKRKQSDRY